MLLNDFSLYFQDTGGYIFEWSLVRISDERKCLLVQDLLGPDDRKSFDTSDSAEGEDMNDFELVRTKEEGAVNPEWNDMDFSNKFKEEGIIQRPVWVRSL